MKRMIEAYAPVGTDAKKSVKLWKIAIGWTTAIVLLSYVASLFSMRSNLYSYSYKVGGNVILEGVLMPEFFMVIGRILAIYLVPALLAAVLVVQNYRYHRTGSMSVYLMKRLPNPWEYHRRCLTIPLVELVLTGVVVAVILLLFWGLYWLVVPIQANPYC